MKAEDKMKAEDEVSPVLAGRNCAATNGSIDDNPYPDDTKESEEWTRGYNEWYIDNYGDVMI